MPYRPTTTILLALCLATPLVGYADEAWDWDALSRAPSLLFLENRVTQDGVVDLYAELDLSIANEGRVMTYFNQSEATDERGNITEAFGLSLTSATDQLISLSMGADYLTQKEAIEIDAYHVTMLLTPNHWQLSLTSEFRQITLYVNPWVRRYRPQIELRTQSRSTTLGVGYYGWDDWAMSMYYRQNRYDANLETLALRPRWSQLVFTQAGLNAAWNLSKRQQGFSLSRYFRRSDLTASYDKNWSAVDGETFFYVALRLGYDLTVDWRVEIEAGDGVAEATKQKSNTYAALAIIRSW